MFNYRKAWALIMAAVFLQLAGGVLNVVTPLGLEALGVGAFSIGLIAAVYAAGFMAGAAIGPMALARIGNIRTFAAAAAATAGGVLAMQLTLDPFAWTMIRLIHGGSFALMLASAESWLGASAPPNGRSGLTAVYHVSAKAALVVGPFFAAGGPPLADRPFLWCGLFLAIALIPVCVSRQAEPPPPRNAPLPLRQLTRVAPAAVLGVFLAGVANTGTLSLLPVFAENTFPLREGGVTRSAAFALAAVWLGGLISQWPAGALSNRFDRRLIIAGLGAIAAVAALGLSVLTGRDPHEATLALLALWGAGSLSFYGVCVAHAADRSNPAEFARVMSGLLFVFAAGSVIGPPLSGLAMRTEFGPGGLFLFAAVVSAALSIAMLVRRHRRAPVIEMEREAWSITQPTSVQGAEIDPRAGSGG
ncbi:MAG: MFS transporter [Pseudomonadota bacterium]